MSGLQFTHGNLQMRLVSGVVLDVAGPVEMQFVNAMYVRVVRGQVTADVGEDGKGIIVDTEQTQVVDPGTKFGVDVAASGHMDVVVFQGVVELFERSSKRAPDSRMTRPVEGEAVRVDERQQMSRIMNVTPGVKSGEWATRDGDGGSVIASVRDNLRDPAARNFYPIVAGGLR